MSISRKLIIFSLVAGFVCSGLSACGGSTTNNDQGTSFTALGFFSDGTGETVLSGASFQVSRDFLGPDEFYPLTLTGFLGLANNLTSQFIRVERFDCQYDVAGADPSLVIPSDSWNVAFVMPAAAVGIDGGPATPTTSFTQFPIVSPDILSFLSVNRNLLPEMPYRLTVSCTAIGVSQAGDTFESNPVFIEAIFHEGQECCTNNGPSVGPGTGGDISGSTEGTTDGSTGGTTVTP